MALGLRRTPQRRRFTDDSHLAMRVLAVLAVVRVLAHIPLITYAGGRPAVSHEEPFFALLDLFSGGSFARGSVLAIALCSYVGGRLIAHAALSWLPQELVSRRTVAWTIVSALAMGPMYLMALPSSSLHAVPLAWRICDIASLSAGSALFLWLAESVVPEFGIAFLVATNVLAASPRYLATELHPASAIPFVLVTLLVALVVQVMAGRGMRTIYVGSWSARGVGRRQYGKRGQLLPIALSPSGPLPLLYALAAFALMRWGTFVLQASQVAWIHRLVTVEDQLTDMHRSFFWIALFVVAVPVMTIYGYAVFNPVEIAHKLNVHATVIPGIGFGRRTAERLFGTWVLTGWVGPVLAMLTIVVPALLYYGRGRDGLWPVILTALLCASHIQVRLLDRLEALLISYGSLLRTRIRGRVS
jgi:preprotein translocase subunit SecY